MCGICGFLDLSGAPASSGIVSQMAATLHHRGPDGSGTHVDGPMALGHTRLKIIDLSAAASQPMLNPDKTVGIVFNGEVYNFQELRRRLASSGHMFRSRSDTEVVLHLYEEKGEKCVEDLDGMFAFAIWDVRRHCLFLARDRAGKKPLYYARTSEAFVFGSEIKALLRHPAVSADLSVDALPHYFAFGYPPRGRTFYRQIEQLPPAHTLTIDRGGAVEVKRYWDLVFRSDKKRLTLSEAEATAEVRQLVTQAVEKRLVSDVPLGAFLSGGLDSSIVVGVMSRLLGKPVKTFSLGFAGDPEFDETRYARTVANHFHTEHTEFIVEPKAIDLVDRLVRHHDGPFGDSSAIPTFIVAQLTRQHVTVALNGDGGDELFAGYLRFCGCLLADRLNPALCRLCRLALGALPEPRNYHNWLRRAQRFFAAASSPLLDRLRRWIAVFDEDLGSVLRPEVFPTLSGETIAYPADLLARSASYSALSRILYVNFMTYLPEDLLVKMDRCTMAHGLEGRSPFLDHRLAEYAAGLPDPLKLRGGTTKYVLRKAFADLLPRDILHRDKKGFGVPLGAWFRGELQDYLHDLLLSPGTLARDYVQIPYVARLMQEHREGIRDHGHRLWALLAFEVWLRAGRHEAVALASSLSSPRA